MFLPMGSALTQFTLYRSTSVATDMGRILKHSSEELGTFSGVLAVASSSEKERWNQLSHPVTHKVILTGKIEIPLKIGDTLRWQSQGKEREMLLCGVPYDVGNLGHYVIVYGNERGDL